MAFQIIRCPYCGNDTEINTDAAKCFCEECGKKLDPDEVLNSETDTLRKQAEKAFSSADYLEAYSLYGKLTDACPGDARAIFRKGLCAAHLSAGRELRIRELMDGYEKASQLLSDKDEQTSIRSSLISFAVGNYKTLARVKSKPVFDSKREAEQFAASVKDSIALLCEVDKKATTEDEQKILYSTRIEACDLGLKCAKLRYQLNQTDPSGESKAETVSFSAGGDLISYARKMRKEAVELYNDLPSMQAEAARLQSGIDTEKGVIKDYQQQRKAYLKSHAEEKSLLKKQQAITIGIGLFLVVLFVVLAIAYKKFWLWATAAGCLLLGWAVFRILTSHFEKEHFPDELLKLRKDSRKSKKALRKKKGEQSKFKSKTMKK